MTSAADGGEVRGQRDLEDDMRPRARLWMCCVGASSCVYTVCYFVRRFDSWLGRNIFSAAFGHVPAKLSPETHPWVQIDSMIAQEPV